jgi:hypothetical protein
MTIQEPLQFVDLDKTPPRFHEISITEGDGVVWHREYIFNEDDTENPKGEFISSEILVFLRT